MFFLFLAPAMFLYLAFAFVWHSIFWGAITIVVMVWVLFALITPLFGRIGCGWFCPFGTIQDLAAPYAFYEIRHKKPFQWLRLLQLAAFVGSGLAFYFMRLHRGVISGVTFAPLKLSAEFTGHYKLVWMIDTVGVMLFTLAVGRRGACRIGCPIGGLCAMGSRHSRLMPVVDAATCTSCGLCEKECPGKVPMMEYIKENQGQVADSECLVCGKCADVCRSKSVKLKMVWKRSSERREHPEWRSAVCDGRAAAGADHRDVKETIDRIG